MRGRHIARARIGLRCIEILNSDFRTGTKSEIANTPTHATAWGQEQNHVAECRRAIGANVGPASREVPGSTHAQPGCCELSQEW